MATVDERLAFVEGRLAEQSQMFVEIRNALLRLEQRVDARCAGLETRFDTRFAALDQLVTAARREAAIDFKWIVGIQVTTLIAVVAALVGALAVR